MKEGAPGLLFQVKSFGGDDSLTKTLCSVLLWHRHLSLKQMSPHKPESTTLFLFSVDKGRLQVEILGDICLSDRCSRLVALSGEVTLLSYWEFCVKCCNYLYAESTCLHEG